jgi:ankyrin repeat protein
MSLVNAGASVNVPDNAGLTALHCAASRGNGEVIQTLVKDKIPETAYLNENVSFLAFRLDYVDQRLTIQV